MQLTKLNAGDESTERECVPQRVPPPVVVLTPAGCGELPAQVDTKFRGADLHRENVYLRLSLPLCDRRASDQRVFTVRVPCT